MDSLDLALDQSEYSIENINQLLLLVKKCFMDLFLLFITVKAKILKVLEFNLDNFVNWCSSLTINYGESIIIYRIELEHVYCKK